MRVKNPYNSFKLFAGICDFCSNQRRKVKHRKVMTLLKLLVLLLVMVIGLSEGFVLVPSKCSRVALQRDCRGIG